MVNLTKNKVYYTADDILAYFNMIKRKKKFFPLELKEDTKKIGLKLIIEDIEEFRNFLVYKTRRSAKNKKKIKELINEKAM